MSVTEMSKVIQERILKKFLEDTVNVREASGSRSKIFSKYPTTPQLRKQFESEVSGHTSIFSQSGLNTLMTKIKDEIEDATMSKYAESLFQHFDFNDFLNNWLPGHINQEIVNDNGVFKIHNIQQDRLKALFLDYLEAHLPSSGIPHNVSSALLDTIEHNIQSGHLAGIFTYKLKLATAVSINMNETGSYRDFTVKLDAGNDFQAYEVALEKIIKLLLDADFITSNIYDNIDVFTKATKSVLGTDSPFFTTELQLHRENKEAGNILQKTGAQLKHFIDSFPNKKHAEFYSDKLNSSFKMLVASLAPLATLLIEQSKSLTEQPDLSKAIAANAREVKELAEIMINTKGSYSVKESILANYKSILETGKVLPKQVTNLASKKRIKKKDTTSSAAAKKAALGAKQLKNVSKELKKAKKNFNIQIRTSGQQDSIISLQNLINANLFERIRKNMGTGERKDILNFRTGRFAQSAKVERMTVSRAGAITAFYSYMKNPYATFSAGGVQQNPRTRDPKLLISKSIRELAAQKVGNRLRAVVV